MMLFGRHLVTRNVPRTLGPLAALGAQTGAVVDANGQPVPLAQHVLKVAGVGAIAGGAAGAAVGLVLGGGALAGIMVGALSGAVGNATLALLGLD